MCAGIHWGLLNSWGTCVCVCVHLGILRSRGTCVGVSPYVYVGPLGLPQLKGHVCWGESMCVRVCPLGHPLVKGYVFLGGVYVCMGLIWPPQLKGHMCLGGGLSMCGGEVRSAQLHSDFFWGGHGFVLNKTSLCITGRFRTCCMGQVGL